MAKRKYQQIWELLKKANDNKISIAIEGAENFPILELKRRFETIRKAVKKEKYNDIHFKVKWPNSELQFTLEQDVRRRYTGMVKIELDYDKKDLTSILI